MKATDALIEDLKLWACSPRVPLKAQIVMIEAIGRLSAAPETRQKPALLDLLTRIQQAAQPIDISHGDDDARIPAVLWREFVDAHAAMLYAKAHGGIDSETGVCNDHGILACEWCRPSSIPSPRGK